MYQPGVLLFGIVFDDGTGDFFEEVHLLGQGCSSGGISVVELGSVGLPFAVSFGCPLIRSGLGCLAWDVYAFAPPEVASVEHDEEFEPCGPRHLVVTIHRLGRGPFHVVEEPMDIFVGTLNMSVPMLADDRWWQVELPVPNVQMCLASDSDIGLGVYLGVVSKYSLFDLILVFPSSILFSVGGNHDFVYPFYEVGVVAMSVLDPLGKSGEALAVNRVNSFICLFIAEVVADLVVNRSSFFSKILFGGVALHFAYMLVVCAYF